MNVHHYLADRAKMRCLESDICFDIGQSPLNQPAVLPRCDRGYFLDTRSIPDNRATGDQTTVNMDRESPIVFRMVPGCLSRINNDIERLHDQYHQMQTTDSPFLLHSLRNSL
jgi:hypothetical protein